MARSECTAKQENKASYNTYYIAPDLMDFFGNDWKQIKTQTEKKNIHNIDKNIQNIHKNIVLTKN